MSVKPFHTSLSPKILATYLGKKKAKRGRPPKPRGEALGNPTPISFQDDELKLFEKEARAEGLTLSEDDTVSVENNTEDEEEETEEQGSMENLDNAGKDKKLRSPAPPPGLKDFPLYLSNSQKAVLYVPSTMSQRDFELLKKQLENSLAVMEAIAVTSDEKPDQ